LGKAGAGLIRRVLERSPIHGEQQVTLVDQLAILEMNLFQIARDPRPHFERIHGNEPADVLVLVDDSLRHRPRHRHLRRRGWRSFCLGFAALASSKRQTECGQQKNGRNADDEIGRWHEIPAVLGYGALQQYRASSRATAGTLALL